MSAPFKVFSDAAITTGDPLAGTVTSLSEVGSIAVRTTDVNGVRGIMSLTRDEARQLIDDLGATLN